MSFFLKVFGEATWESGAAGVMRTGMYGRTREERTWAKIKVMSSDFTSEVSATF